MKRIKFALKQTAILALLISSFIACDKDFASVGSDIIGDNNFDAELQKYNVTAYTNVLEPVQTNNLPLNYLGAYKDPTYGLTTANFVSQIGTASYSPDFGEGVILDSVVLTVPYFSRVKEVTSTGETLYQLDSVYGNGLINLEIYENKYFLSSINPSSEFGEPLNYFSNTATTTSSINPALLEGTPLYSQLNFQPDGDEIRLENLDGEITERLAPALRVKLNPLFWKQKIIDMQDEPELSNSNNFYNYFRGLYFKAIPVGGNGSMALMNFSAAGANITLYYTKDGLTEDADPVQSTYAFTFSGNKANFLENQFNVTIPQGDPLNGDEKLYLKGAQGSNAVIDLFNGGTSENGFSTQFKAFKNEFVETDTDGKFVKPKRLINEANLIFYVDQSLVNGNEPNRIYLYDIKNGTPLIDYFVDLANNTVPDNSRLTHLGALKRQGDTPSGEGIRYKIRITEHLNNLLLRDSTNVKLGLAVSANINLEGTSPQFKVLTSDSDIVNKIPVSSILNPKGTVLYGNNTANEEKKLYLEIYYTEPNN